VGELLLSRKGCKRGSRIALTTVEVRLQYTGSVGTRQVCGRGSGFRARPEEAHTAVICVEGSGR
jgi:hypothetical protein